ncbi:aromatic ring-hydroxylating oxygenase subunit alpha [Streptomyces sp. NBC_01803]|uniref:aromatic ring-hydroxylating oxygenase subunit alpha n=1 Tax=Streptomyces sp. NBC_01803 TaxID=2975946 RepID=UPI002DDAC9B5|nr:aromatic ring-hydroxylating dioxygenase subunit alpha [Streptomyces sp. NBC_01803]WSA45034.1 aromatic ring-hydroxylating dioxygenase subunit alpha [Streptomyces sp. NBC_01803]
MAAPTQPTRTAQTDPSPRASAQPAPPFPGPLDGRPVGRGILPADAYTDPAVFAAETRAIFERRWVWAGFEHWVATPGSSRPITVAGRPLLLARDKDGTLRVFHNVCRHRGLVLSEEPSTRSRLRCPYHSWTFELDGSLCGTPYFARTKNSAPDDETRAALGLLPVRHTEWAGMILVNLDEHDSTSADELLAPLRRRWQPVGLDRLHLAAERRYDIAANWKLVVENFLDYYHLPFVHPQVGPATAALDIDDVVLSDRILGGCYPRGAMGKARKTETPLPLFADDLPQEMADRQDIFCVFPNALVFLEADWFQVIGYEPVAPGQTVEHLAVFVDAAAATDTYADARAALCQVLFEVNDQDVPILERMQRGRHSPAADRSHLVPHWDQVTARFQLLVAEALTDVRAAGTEGADRG